LTFGACSLGQRLAFTRQMEHHQRINMLHNNVQLFEEGALTNFLSLRKLLKDPNRRCISKLPDESLLFLVSLDPLLVLFDASDLSLIAVECYRACPCHIRQPAQKFKELDKGHMLRALNISALFQGHLAQIPACAQLEHGDLKTILDF
jgi:hypothetical protein